MNNTSQEFLKQQAYTKIIYTWTEEEYWRFEVIYDQYQTDTYFSKVINFLKFEQLYKSQLVKEVENTLDMMYENPKKVKIESYLQSQYNDLPIIDNSNIGASVKFDFLIFYDDLKNGKYNRSIDQLCEILFETKYKKIKNKKLRNMPTSVLIEAQNNKYYDYIKTKASSSYGE